MNMESFPEYLPAHRQHLQ